MKILNLEQFLQMRPGTVFAKYAPAYFEDICIKGDSLETRDFINVALLSVRANSSDELDGILEDAEMNGSEFALDLDFWGRDGCFERDQLFAVYEREDVEQLISKLNACLTEGYPKP
jgi:hypothetical protein